MIKVANNLHSLCVTQAQLNVPAFKFAAEEGEEKGSDKKKKVGPDYGLRFRRGAISGAIPGALLGSLVGGIGAGQDRAATPASVAGSTLLGALLGGGLGGGVTGLGNMANAYLNEDLYNEGTPNYEQRALRGALLGGGAGGLGGLLTGSAIAGASNSPSAGMAPIYLALLGGAGGAALGGLSNAQEGYLKGDMYNKNAK